MTCRVDLPSLPDIGARIDGRDANGVSFRFYSRHVMGREVHGLWIDGRPIFDVNVYAATGEPLGVIEPEAATGWHLYDELRRVLVTEEFRT